MDRNVGVELSLGPKAGGLNVRDYLQCKGSLKKELFSTFTVVGFPLPRSLKKKVIND
jgi:hypothetical protein